MESSPKSSNLNMLIGGEDNRRSLTAATDMSDNQRQFDSATSIAAETQYDPESTLEKKLAPKKPVARVLPSFIDLIILLLQIAIFGGFLFMAYFYDDLNSPWCIADAYSDLPYSNESD
jgi:hypothetical protein